jgi:DNA-binding transcriptional ArsR family regulator
MTKLVSRFSKDVYERNANIYKILANAKRLEILNAIREREATVTELSKLLGVRKANTSQHLMILRHLGLVKVRKSGKFAFYQIIDPGLVEPCRILKELHEKKKIRS